MYRSLASVGIIGILSVAAVLTVNVQNVTSQTTEGLVLKNHISDAERDRLMQEAMDKAHAELEAKKAKAAADKAREAEQKKDAEIARLAGEEAQLRLEGKEPADTTTNTNTGEMPGKLATAAEESSSYSTSVLEPLPSLGSLDLDKVEKVETLKSESDSPKKPVSAKDEKPAISKKKTVASKEPAAPEPKAPAKIETSNNTGGTKDVDKDVSYYDAKSDSTDSDVSDSQSVQGQVVGLMRSNGTPRVLLRDEKGRMVQVIIENDDIKVPAPASVVSVRGRSVGGSNGQIVLSASTVNIKSGGAVPSPQRSSRKTANNDEAAIPRPGMPVPAMQMPPYGMMPRPMVMPPPFMMMPPRGPY